MDDMLFLKKSVILMVPLVAGCSIGHELLILYLCSKLKSSVLITLMYVQMFIFSELFIYLMPLKGGDVSWLTAEPYSWLGGQLYGRELVTAAPPPGHWWCRRHKMAALKSAMFRLHFCTIGGSGDMLSFFISVSVIHRKEKKTQKHPSIFKNRTVVTSVGAE